VYIVVPPGGCFREPRRIELGPRVLTIGRAESCEVRLDVPGVDDEHAKISEVALIALGADCAIGDVPLDTGSRRLVTPGDEIQIGSVVVALEGDDPDAPNQLSSGTVEMPGIGRRRPEGPRVRVVEGENFGDELVLKQEGKEYVIGRHADCDLVLEDREVSREHIKLVRRGYAVFIQDLSSTRGSWLGRSAVYSGSTLEWARPRMLRVGASVLSLELPDAVRKAAPPPLASAPHTPEPRRSGPLSHSPSSVPVGPSESPPQAHAGRQPYAFHDVATTPPPEPTATGTAPMMVPMTPMPAPPAATSSAPMVVPPPSVAPHNRTAWKKSGTTIGRGSGILLLVLAALAVLGALFVVFSLLE
jgi:pSer/pThr/pTyr-binding forkhead associated (FHA) protein